MKIDYKMMREASKDVFFGEKLESFGRMMGYANNKDRRKVKRERTKKVRVLSDQARDTRRNIFLNICNRSYTGPIYQPESLKERFSEGV